MIVTRQMKTLTYSLASTKCMDDGWTVRPLSPVRTESSDHLEPFEIEINSSRAQVNCTFYFYVDIKMWCIEINYMTILFLEERNVYGALLSKCQ